MPHLAKGMVAPLEVTGTATTTELPAGDASLTLKDFSFDLNSLTAGKHTINVKNDGPQPHEATIIKLNDGVTVDTILGMATATPPRAARPRRRAGLRRGPTSAG